MINIFGILYLACLLPAALALPLNMYEDLPEAYNLPALRYDLSVSYAFQSSFSTVHITTGAVPTVTSAINPYPTATGSMAGTGFSYPTDSPFDKHKAEALALKKRHAFQGPRHRHHPHTYPYVPQSNGYLMPTTAATSEATGTAPSLPFQTAPTPTGTGLLRRW